MIIRWNIPDAELVNILDAGLEEAINDSYAMRSFLHIDFYKEQVPDATTML